MCRLTDWSLDADTSSEAGGEARPEAAAAGPAVLLLLLSCGRCTPLSSGEGESAGRGRVTGCANASMHSTVSEWPTRERRQLADRLAGEMWKMWICGQRHRHGMK